jgi:hypothetical protein
MKLMSSNINTVHKVQNINNSELAVKTFINLVSYINLLSQHCYLISRLPK